MRWGSPAGGVPVPLVGDMLTQAIEPLRPFLALNLLQSLARLSHTYMLGSIPAYFPEHGQAGDDTRLSIAQTAVHVLTDAGAEALALGLSLASTPATPASITSAFAGTTQTVNAALVLSATGLSQLLDHAREQGRLQGRFRDARTGVAEPWRWKELACVPSGNGQVQVSGRLEARGQQTEVTEIVACRLDPQGQLVILPGRPLDDMIVGALQGALLQVLGLGNADEGDSHLRQIFTIPASRISVETAAVGLDIDAGSLTLLYNVPLRQEKIGFQFPARRPAVRMVQQPPLPTASRPGAPLAVTLRAQVVNESFSPYDFAWTTNETPVPTEGAERQVVATTPAGVTPGTHTLTTAHLWMTDLIGQVAADEKPVQYLVRKRSRVGRTAVIAAVVAALVISCIGIGIVFGHGGSSTTSSTPVPTATATVMPTPVPVIGFRALVYGSGVTTSTGAWSQDCVSNTTMLDTTSLLLDNTTSNVPISWHIAFANQTYPLPPSDIWADVTASSSGSPSSSGETAAGSSTTLTITPDQNLCSWLSKPGPVTFIDFLVVVTYNPENPDAQPITFTDQIGVRPSAE